VSVTDHAARALIDDLKRQILALSEEVKGRKAIDPGVYSGALTIDRSGRIINATPGSRVLGWYISSRIQEAANQLGPVFQMDADSRPRTIQGYAKTVPNDTVVFDIKISAVGGDDSGDWATIIDTSGGDPPSFSGTNHTMDSANFIFKDEDLVLPQPSGHPAMPTYIPKDWFVRLDCTTASGGDLAGVTLTLVLDIIG
jgi:hypothetical protein